MMYRIILFVICLTLYTGVVQAQDSASPDDPDSSSEQAEQAEAREDAYRKRMELEGSRDQDTFSNTTYTKEAKQEKIDKLPKESRDNIREQLTDIIIENGQWEPFDALREYPYEPTEAARENPGLREQEQEAWAEQMEKYHQRESNAYGASRPSMPGSESRQAAGSPDPGDQQGESEGEGEQQGQSQGGAGESQGEEGEQGEGQDGEGESQGKEGQQGSQGSSSSSASSNDTYQPQQSDDPDEISTAGVSESALDFLRSRQEQGSGSAGQAASSDEAMDQQEAFSQAKDGAENGAEDEAATAQQSSQDSQQQSESEFIIPGIIAIEDLDKLEGLAEPEDDSENL